MRLRCSRRTDFRPIVEYRVTNSPAASVRRWRSPDLPAKKPVFQFKMNIFDSGIDIKRLVLYLVLVGVVVSFLVGDLLGENSIGSSRPDFEGAHWKAIQLFSEVSWSDAITNYPSATNPLLYIIASL